MAGAGRGRGKKSTIDEEVELHLEEQLPLFVWDLQVHLLFLSMWVCSGLLVLCKPTV
jgi:hypothetical protein